MRASGAPRNPRDGTGAPAACIVFTSPVQETGSARSALVVIPPRPSCAQRQASHGRDPATTISGIDSRRVLRQNLGVARGFRPLSTTAMQRLRTRCAEQAADGRFELYKTTARFEAAVGRKQHGFPPPDEQDT